MNKPKEQKTVLITGSGRGIGAACATLFAKRGYRVCINYHQDNVSAETLASQIIANGGEVMIRQANLSEESEVTGLFLAIDKNFGKLSALVNNAAIIMPQARLENMTAERINTVFKANITNYFLCCREAVKRMSTKNGGAGGSIVNVSSRASVTGSPEEYIDYAASKGAIDTLTIGLSKEVASEGIRVNAVRPGLIYTNMHADAGEATRVDRLKTKVPMRRGGNSQEVAEAIFWLSSEKASFTTGSFIDVSGGL